MPGRVITMSQPQKLSYAPQPNAELRQRAEACRRHRFSDLDPQATPEQMRSMVHELQVQQIELELQNEALRQTVAGLPADRLRTDAALAASEARWQFALEGAGDGVWDWDLVSNQVFYSRQWKTMLGYAEDEIGETPDEWETRIHPDDKTEYAQNLARLFARETPIFHNEARIRSKDGTYKWVLNRGKVIEWTNDCRPRRMIGTQTDITERRQTEDSLLRLAAIVESATDAIIGGEVNGVVQTWNHSAESLYGYTAAEMIGRFPTILTPPAHSEDKNLISDHIATGTGLLQHETQCLTKDGRLVDIALTAFPIKNAAGETIGTATLAHDISQRKQLQHALETLNQQLETRIVERTNQYLVTIQQLEEEIATRERVEQQLRQLQDNLVERVAAQGRKLNKLYEATLVNDEASGMEQVLAEALAKMADLMEADAVCVHEVEGDHLVLVASQGLTAADRQRLQLLPGDWLDAGLVLTSSDLRQDLRVPLPLKQTVYAANIAIQIRLSQTENGVLQGFWRAQRRVAVEDIASFAIMAEQIAILLENVRLRRRLERKAIQLERRRLARELHDSVTQSLHGLTLYVAALRNRLQRGQTEKVEETLSDLDQTARQTLKEVRLLLYEFRVDPQENLRLVEQIQTRLEAVEQRAGVDATLELSGRQAWPEEWEAQLYPIVMEALNNAIKHANASQVRIYLRGGQNWLELRICDNGSGFQTPMARRTGIGLQSMRERAKLLGGVLWVESTIGEGTQIHLRIGTTAGMEGDANNGTDSRLDCR